MLTIPEARRYKPGTVQRHSFLPSKVDGTFHPGLPLPHHSEGLEVRSCFRRKSGKLKTCLEIPVRIRDGSYLMYACYLVSPFLPTEVSLSSIIRKWHSLLLSPFFPTVKDLNKNSDVFDRSWTKTPTGHFDRSNGFCFSCLSFKNIVFLCFLIISYNVSWSYSYISPSSPQTLINLPTHPLHVSFSLSHGVHVMLVNCSGSRPALRYSWYSKHQCTEETDILWSFE